MRPASEAHLVADLQFIGEALQPRLLVSVAYQDEPCIGADTGQPRKRSKGQPMVLDRCQPADERDYQLARNAHPLTEPLPADRRVGGGEPFKSEAQGNHPDAARFYSEIKLQLSRL